MDGRFSRALIPRFNGNFNLFNHESWVFEAVDVTYKWRVPSITKSVGITIREFRKAQNISRETLAERAGLHPNYVGAVERGEMNAGIENIEKLAKALKTPLYKLFLRPRTKPDPVLDELLAIATTADDDTLTLMASLLRTVKEWKSGRKVRTPILSMAKEDDTQ